MSNIHITVATHQGKLFDEVCEHVVIKSKDGEFAIYPNHVAVITTFSDGYVKMVRDEQELFVCLLSALVEFNKNKLTVLAQEAHIGKDKDSAHRHMEEARRNRLEQNRKLDADLALQESEIINNLKKSRAGEL